MHLLTQRKHPFTPRCLHVLWTRLASKLISLYQSKQKTLPERTACTSAFPYRGKTSRVVPRSSLQTIRPHLGAICFPPATPLHPLRKIVMMFQDKLNVCMQLTCHVYYLQNKHASYYSFFKPWHLSHGTKNQLIMNVGKLDIGKLNVGTLISSLRRLVYNKFLQWTLHLTPVYDDSGFEQKHPVILIRSFSFLLIVFCLFVMSEGHYNVWYFEYVNCVIVRYWAIKVWLSVRSKQIYSTLVCKSLGTPGQMMFYCFFYVERNKHKLFFFNTASSLKKKHFCKC